MLSQDIIKVPAGDLPRTESVLSVVGGKVVYDAKVSHDELRIAFGETVPLNLCQQLLRSDAGQRPRGLLA